MRLNAKRIAEVNYVDPLPLGKPLVSLVTSECCSKSSPLSTKKQHLPHHRTSRLRGSHCPVLFINLLLMELLMVRIGLSVTA